LRKWGVRGRRRGVRGLAFGEYLCNSLIFNTIKGCSSS
jgi:hypothetical protein